MKIYYVMETRGRRCHIRTALGVDAKSWNRFHRRVREWRRQLEQRYGTLAADRLVPGGPLSGTHQFRLSCDCGCHAGSALPQEAALVAQALRVVEDFAVETGGVQVVNVCLDLDEAPAYRRVALDRLFNRINATADRENDYAILIFGQEPEENVVRTYERLRSRNPVPVRADAAGDGWHTRNLPINRIIGSPVFRDPGTDWLLQVAGLVARALLWQEEPPGVAAGIDAENHAAFSVLDCALNRRASRRDPQGVVRR
ncbi:MAG: hypothetical protein F4Z05_03255 [Chloroflexi bacterium]|nr:hypothetical protein [Chloroflexota bacterium]